MNLKVLIVIPKKEVRDFVIDILESLCNDEDIHLQIDKEESFQDALDRCRHGAPYRLIVSHLHIFERRKAPLVETQRLGLTLFQTLNREGSHIPGILLTPDVDDEQLALAISFPNFSPVPMGGHWAEHIGIIAARSFAKPSETKDQAAARVDRQPQKKVQVDFFIYPNSDTWAMVFRGEGNIICDPTPRLLKVNLAKINQTRIKDCMIDKYRGNYPDWKIFLNDIGEVLLREILLKNPEVLDYYTRLSGEVGGCENFRIRFITGEETYPLNLEAILVPSYQDNEDFWMLKAPVCRRLNVGDLRMYPLFENPNQKEMLQEINCLVIKADVHGWEKKSKIELNQLENISVEARQLGERLSELEANHTIGTFMSIPKGNTECTREAVEATLKSGKEWHLVHYAGHSHYTADDKGYVFFSKEGRPDPVDIQDFAQWLRQAKTRFVYLSSCESSKLKFVHELAKKWVPAVIGYRWDIDDDKAAEQANIFYDHLFREQSLEYAFLKTRQQVSQECPEHIIWAAPVLVMQALQN